MALAATEPLSTAHGHLLAELARLELVVRRQVVRLRAANLLTEDEFRGLYIADEQIDALLGGSANDADAVVSIRALDGLIERARTESEERVVAAGAAELPLPRLARLFGLSRLEVDILLVAVAPELDLRWETLYAYVQNDVTKKRPTVDLALKLFLPTIEDRLAARDAFAPDAPLLRHRLLRVLEDSQERDPPLLGRFLKADARVVDFLLDAPILAAELESFAAAVTPTRRLDELPVPEEVRRLLAAAASQLRWGSLALVVGGPQRAEKDRVAEAVAAQLGVPLVTADLSLAAADERDLREVGALLRREATLRGAALFLDRFETLLTADARAHNRARILVRELAQFEGPLVLASEEPWDASVGGFAGGVVAVDVPVPDATARVALWQSVLPPGTSVDVASLAQTFKLGAADIERAAADAWTRASLRADDGAIAAEDVQAAARAQSSHALAALAQQIEPVYRWSDIVLPPRALRSLHEVCSSVRFRHVVHAEWRFDRKVARGGGLNALFSGPSGTGKTMAAEIVADDLGLDLYKIDLPNVVSKYIGETEQNLSRIFSAAEAGNAILFFDEADALFGRRSEVRDAHDRYANIEVAYLLQRMDDYKGVVILATNLSKNIDDAFARRMHHTVEFPFPDAALRTRIWRGVFPPEAPLADDVDLPFLAQQFELAGGNIRNVALAAAFMAAEDGGRIEMRHVVTATARELEKLGRLPSRADFRQYYELVFAA